MEVALLIFLVAAFGIGSPSFVIVACMGLLKRYINRYFAYGALTTLVVVLICYYLYSFFVKEEYYRLINKLGCEYAQNEPDVSLGIMHCYTYLNVFLDFFAYPLIMVLMVTSLFWIAMCIMTLMRYGMQVSIKTKPKEFKRKSFLYGIFLYAMELLLLGSMYVYARMIGNGNIIFVIVASIFGATLILVVAKIKQKRGHNEKF